MPARPLPREFLRETIDGAKGPCPAYSGYAGAVKTLNGIPVIILAATRTALVDVIKEIAPDTAVDASLFKKASIIHDTYILRDDL
jgi:hypothetical protein